jgi:hypothetical protein
MKFNPTLSFDGVALICALVGLCLWLGALKTTVEDHTKQLADISITTKHLSENQTRLTTLIEERTEKGVQSSTKFQFPANGYTKP